MKLAEHLSRLKPIVAPLVGLLFMAAGTLLSTSASAHGVPDEEVQRLINGGPLDYLRSGAVHMVTGYDHLLFLFGVMFFLTRFGQIAKFVTAFTIGHCITLLGATLLGIKANYFLVDAVIAISVIYKGFDNLDGFRKTLGVNPPNLLLMVLGFGLIHGFGLATRLQGLPLPKDGLDQHPGVQRRGRAGPDRSPGRHGRPDRPDATHPLVRPVLTAGQRRPCRRRHPALPVPDARLPAHPLSRQLRLQRGLALPFAPGREGKGREGRQGRSQP
jgi:hydrogenase/urease accessory protein HupE